MPPVFKFSIEATSILTQGGIPVMFHSFGVLISLVLVVAFSGVAFSDGPTSLGNNAITPAFASPCSSNDTCRELDACADADFGRCKAFKGVTGLRRVLSEHWVFERRP